MAYETNKGDQQVSVFPFQELTSYNANQLLYGVFSNGVFEGDVSVYEGSDPAVSELGLDGNSVVFRIHGGASLIFKREYTIPAGDTKEILGKVVLQEDAHINITKTLLFADTYATAYSITIMADWDYDQLDSSKKYVDFSIGSNENKDFHTNPALGKPKLILAEFLNHQELVTQYGILGAATPVTSYQKYIPTISDQPYRIIRRLEEQASVIPVAFVESVSGKEIEVGPYVMWNSDAIMFLPTAVTVSASPPAVTVTSGVADDYYQIDVLRVKTNIDTKEAEVEWSSFLAAEPTTGLDFTDISNISQEDLLTYLHGIELGVVDSGRIVLIGVRDRALVETTQTVLWPGQCWIPDFYVPQVGASRNISQLTLPVYSDI